MAERLFIFKRFERFWHWSQAILIITMMITGFEIHGAYRLFGFGQAVVVHTSAAWALLTIWAFAIVWQFTTGEWKQYLPTFKRVDVMIKYYAWDIFSGAAHPYHKSLTQKHNPLQRLAYLAFLAFMSPIVWGSGLLYLFYGDWHFLGIDHFLSLQYVAFAHVVGAYFVLIFFIVHVYLAMSGPKEHLRAMITGWEEIHSPEATDASSH
jgi:thiosulfate reductase cytochrome b subunit